MGSTSFFGVFPTLTCFLFFLNLLFLGTCIISPGEERGNETGKVAIAHGSVEFCEATPIGLADES